MKDLNNKNNDIHFKKFKITAATRITAVALAAIAFSQAPLTSGITGKIISYAADYSLSTCYWDPMSGKAKAEWEKSESSQSYTVQLYLDGERVSGSISGAQVKTSSASCDFTEAIIKNNKTGFYTFTVRGSKGDKDTIESDTLEITEAEIESLKEFGYFAESYVHSVDASGKRIGPEGAKGVDYGKMTGNPSLTGPTVTTIAPPVEETKAEETKPANRVGKWKSSGGKWQYIDVDGNFVKDEWKMIDGDWFLFSPEGYRMTGWVEREGKWYYLAEDSETEERLPGTLYTNTTTPDGYHVGEDGSMIEQ